MLNIGEMTRPKWYSHPRNSRESFTPDSLAYSDFVFEFLTTRERIKKKKEKKIAEEKKKGKMEKEISH